MSIRRSISGGQGPARITPSKDPYRTWFIKHRDTMESKGHIGVLVNPSGAAVELAAELEPFAIYRCLETRFLFANPRIKPRGAEAYFSSDAVSAYFPVVEQSIAFRIENNYQPVARMLRERLGAGMRLLEVGCGGGGFLEVLRDAGFSVEGVETASGAVPYWKQRGLVVHQGLLEEFQPSMPYDIVLMWSVMDHFYDPIGALRTCHTLLRPGGWLFIGNVNTSGFDHYVMGFDCATFSPPGRVNYYGVESLSAHLHLAGFHVVEVSTPGRLDVDMVREYWRTGGSNGRHSFMEGLVNGVENAAVAFQHFLSDNKLSGYQTILARRRDE
jgi:SAM-dependent methyltransferase